MSGTSGHEPAEVVREFHDAVNMTPKQLAAWLKDERSREVGIDKGGEKKSDASGSESVGHESGRRIVTLLQTTQDELSEDDLAHMRKVTGYVHRHLAQKPTHEDVESSRWRASLMNWGHDPLAD